ncbi:2,3,4,5-tetrahydropyridine-2,6-dicarboxylate N-succinyltransferase [Gossypium arboreum]|uniref:2,3,4,5-tetrahydropyridine-2,6-dicarboxylate N-succinyltransferase n=1 Tax=Gossypium arboreum TaxID=29729 RepID=A0A0B0N872_GOSAR|nr:2,3,4,5-tetrahydropyridine-2,6-dicarboxylate N-succinyltransferase [Gossypium arboreum]
MRASVRPCLGHGIDIEMRASVRHVWDMHRLRDCKSVSGTWHRHGYVRASVRPCLGHGVGLNFDSQCKTMSGTWHRLDG